MKMKFTAPLDKQFQPMELVLREYEADVAANAHQKLYLALERSDGCIERYDMDIFADGVDDARSCGIVERFVKTILWTVGGWKITVCGSKVVYDFLRTAYRKDGLRQFDAGFMSRVYEHPFEVVYAQTPEALPAVRKNPSAVGRHLDGCRIGFDAGGSDRKVSAVIDGEPVYSEEVVWNPKLSEDPQYQFDGIVDSFKTAASKMPRVDAIGVSSAGVFIGNAPMVSSLFIKVPRSRREEVKTIYDRAAKEIGDIPIVVANDGDVTALAGAMSLETGGVLGIAMGTSEAGGYVAPDGNVLGWFNELAFAPVDLNENAAQDEWSGDIGVGCKYFSQDAVIKLAPAAGIELDESFTPAQKLSAVQALLEQGHAGAEKIFLSIGSYLAHTLALYGRYYEIRYLLVLGRVASGKGGELIVSECNRVLKDEYPDFKGIVMLPDEKTRRVGQSVAAPSLPAIR